MSGMHADEVAVDDATVRRLLAAQLPEWAGLTVRRLPPTGTDNQLFRLGDDLLVRMPRVPGPTRATCSCVTGAWRR
jgi:aminoglycoside phosphotransferase (APT) family kinase protein